MLNVYDIKIDSSGTNAKSTILGHIIFDSSSAGKIVLSTNNIVEGSNFYFTNSRVFSAVGGSSGVQASRTLLIQGTSNRISVSGGTQNLFTNRTWTVNIDSNYVGQSSIITLGNISTGTWNGSTITAFKGGTDQTSYTIGDILYASGSAALSKLVDVSVGSYLRSGGIGAAPLWSTAKLPNTGVQGDIIHASTTNNFTSLAIGSANKVLVSTGTLPSWGTVSVGGGGTGITTYATGDIIYANGVNTLGKLAKGNSGQVLIGGSTPSWGVVAERAVNGLSVISGSTGLGGTLTQNTTENISTFTYLISGTSSLAIKNSGIFLSTSSGHSVSLRSDLLSANRTVQFPNKSGTVAMLSDITGGTSTPTAINGLSVISGSVGLGGSLIQNTNLNLSTFNFLVKDINNKNIEDFKNRSLNDTSGLTSIDWRGRTLNDNSNINTINWQNKTLLNNWSIPSKDFFGIGIYGTISETGGGLSYITGNSIKAHPTTNNTLIKTSNDPGHFIRMRYDVGISFHSYLPGAIGTTFNDYDNQRFIITSGNNGGYLEINDPINDINHKNSIDSNNRLLFDSNNSVKSIDWQARKLYSTSGVTLVDWQDGKLEGFYTPSGNWDLINKNYSDNGTQTLTNKTLTSPKINLGGDATGDIYYRDGSGNLARLAEGTKNKVLTTGTTPSFKRVNMNGRIFALSNNNFLP